MSAISALSADFEGTDGVYVYNTATSVNNPGAIGATQVTGSGTARFDGSNPKMGSTALTFNATANQVNARWDVTTNTTFWDDIYILTPSTTGTGTPIILQWAASDLTTIVGSVRMNLADLSLQLRDGSTTVWSSAGLTPSTWIRVSIKAIPGSSTGHELKVYTSSGGNAASPDQQSGGQPCTSAGAANVASFRMGVLTNATMTFSVDRNRADNATEPAGLTTGLPPTVNAGPDLTKEVGSSNFTITATATPSGGSTIASRSWQIFSGNTVTLTGTTTDTVTITPPTSTTGSTVLRYTATQNDAQSTTDDVTLTWVAAGQTLYPVGDVSNPGSFTTQSGATSSLFASIDEVVLDTTDYIASPQLSATPAVYRTRLQNKTAPTNTTGWLYRTVVACTADVASFTLTIKLYEADGTTLRKTFPTITTVNQSFVEYDLTLTSGEVTAITTWTSGLIIEYSVTGA